jgi:hypothetical protein
LLDALNALTMAGTRTHGSRTGRESAGVSTDQLHSVFMTSSSTPLFDTVLQQLDLDLAPWRGQGLAVRAPRDGTVYAQLSSHTPAQAQALIEGAHSAFLQWRNTPAPVRGELVRRLGEKLRQHKEALGLLVSLEAGKVRSEGLGEVQEMIDICDFAVGLSRQLHGLTIASERPGHRMMETWHPMGVVGVISAFNFPVAVWSWNTALGAGVRQRGGLETVRENAPHGHCLPASPAARHSRIQYRPRRLCPRRPERAAAGRARDG